MNKNWVLFTGLILCSPVLLASDVESMNREINKITGVKNEKGNILPVPIPILNPTLGLGLAGALIYMHPPKSGAEDSPNATSALAAMYTDSESWLVGAFHDDYLFQDNLRVRGGVGSGEFNINYFGSGEDPAFADSPLEYSLSADLAFGQALSRVPFTEKWFGGVRAFFMQATVGFELSSLIPEIPDLPTLESGLNISNLGLVVNFDDKDNSFYPTTGKFFEATLGQDNDKWGSDYNFTRLTASYNHYFPVTSKQVIALQAYASEVNGNAPFFLLPSLDIRGLSFGRYQDNAIISAHMEWRYKFHPRWGVMVSFEAGEVGNSLGELNEDVITSAGLGVRWQLSADQPLHIGFDVGISGNSSAAYLRIGEKF